MAGFGLFQTRVELLKPTKAKGRKKNDQLGTYNAEYYQKQGCDSCINKEKCVNVQPIGKKHPTVYVLGEQPKLSFDKEPRMFGDASGERLRRLMQGTDCRFNAVVCTPFAKDKPIGMPEVEACRSRVVEDIERTKPKVIIAAGPIALSWFTNSTEIEKWRGRRLPVKVGEHKCWCYPIVDPSILKSEDRRDEKHRAVLKLDVARALREAENPLPLNGLPFDLKHLDDGIELASPKLGIKWVEKTLAYAATCERTTIDIETTGKRPYEKNAKILTMAVTTDKWSRAFPISHPEAWWDAGEQFELKDLIRHFLNSKTIKVCHNAPFELEWFVFFYGTDMLKKKGWFRWECTQAQTYCIDERRKYHAQKLEHVCQERLGMRLKEQSDVDKARLAIAPLEKVLLYNARDTKFTAMADAIQCAELKRLKLWDYYRDQIRRIPSLVLLQKKGLPVDIPTVQKLEEQFTKKIHEVTKKIQACPEAVAYRKEYGVPVIVKGNGVKTCLRRIFGHLPELFDENGENFTTDASVLVSVKSELAKMILEYREYSKLRDTYMTPMLPGGKLLYSDCKLHQTVTHTFTDTGRLSSKGPNCQNIPKRKHSEVRGIIIAPPGHKIVAADAKQLEVCVVAVMSKDPVLLRQVQDKVDIHMKYTEILSKYVPEYLELVGHGQIKLARSAIKNLITFPFFYGAFWSTAARNVLKEIAKVDRKVSDRVREKVEKACKKIEGEFWQDYRGVKKWQNQQIRLYEQRGYVECMNGRRRRGPLSINQLINATIQGSACDLIVDAMIRLSRMAINENRPQLQAALNIHDDLTFFIPDATFDDDVADIVHEMTHSSYDWIKACPMGIEVSVGPNWYNMEVLDTFYSDAA